MKICAYAGLTPFSADSTGRNYVVTDLAGRTTSVNYACCGLDSVTDPDGVLTSYAYDPLMRQVAVTTARGSTNITMTNILDGVGQTIARERIGSDGSVIALGQSQYDALGRATNQVNALGGTNSISYSSGSNPLCVTNINPDGGTTIQNYNYDRTLQLTTGTAPAPVQYQYGIEPDGSDGPYRKYTLTVKLTTNNVAASGTNEWTKTYTDGVGRPYKTLYATNSGAPPYSISYYNSLGQLATTVDADGVATVYAYNGKGERQYTVMNARSDFTYDPASTNRMIYTTNDVVTDSVLGFDVQRQRTYVWSVNNSSVSNLIAMTETSTDGLNTWSITTNGVSGAASITNHSQTVYGGTGFIGFRYLTNTAPDGSYSVSVFDYGLLASVTRYDLNHTQILQTIYGYDPHGRQNTAYDARNGLTTYTFNNADQIATVTTPVPASGISAEVTSTYYDSMGRNTGSLLPDGTTTTNSYLPTGQLKQTSGSRTYPVGYGYDAQNRITTMTNWANFAANAGARVTTWTYDAYRGLLAGKTYDGGASGPSYTYTGAGRLATRLWARGTNTTYTYNPGGDLWTVIYNDGSTPGVTNAYDRRGRLMTVTNGETVTSLTYNDQNQALVESYTGGPVSGCSVTNWYDALLRRTNLVASNGRILNSSIYFYDAASRLATVSDGTNSATYSYLANSPLVSGIDFRNLSTVCMRTIKSYDHLDRLTSVTSTNLSSAVLDSHSYAYNSANQRTSMTNADGTYWIYGYDALGQVTSGIKYWPDGTVVAGQQFGYAFDKIGNRQTSSSGGDQFGANLRYENYAANNLNQYTARTVPGAVDVIGTATNMADVTVNNQTTYRKGTYYRTQLPITNSAGPVFQSATNLAVLVEGTNYNITTNINGNILLPPANQVFSYDADGNLLADGVWNYGWDAENRLVSMTNVSALAAAAQKRLNFAYDYLGRRIQKIVATNNTGTWTNISTNVFIYDGWNLIAQLNAANSTLTQSYQWGLDLSGSVAGAGGVGGLVGLNVVGIGVGFPTCDGNGNVAALIATTSSGIVAQYEYGPFGEVIRANGPMAKLNPFRFSTKYQDNETDLLYYGYRYYNASTGRWLSRDPLEEPGFENLRNSRLFTMLQMLNRLLGNNLYCLLDNQPISVFDVLGLNVYPYPLCPPGNKSAVARDYSSRKSTYELSLTDLFEWKKLGKIVEIVHEIYDKVDKAQGLWGDVIDSYQDRTCIPECYVQKCATTKVTYKGWELEPGEPVGNGVWSVVINVYWTVDTHYSYGPPGNYTPPQCVNQNRMEIFNP